MSLLFAQNDSVKASGICSRLSLLACLPLHGLGDAKTGAITTAGTPGNIAPRTGTAEAVTDPAA
jgi:hypothetical protein